MAIPLFWRLILGYAAILLLTISTSLYSIVQLGALSQSARAAIHTDYRTIANQETMTDAFLSEVRYGGKYLITQSPATYDQFVQFKNDFLRSLRELKGAAIPDAIVNQLSDLEHLHHGYQDLFEQEVRYIKARQPYAQSRYQQEREKVLDNTLRNLARLKEQLQQNVQDKLEQMSGSAHTARKITIVTTLMLIVLGTTLSLKISSSITKSLSEFKRQTQEEISGPEHSMPPSQLPELQELSVALTQRIRQLNEAVEKNASLVLQLTEDLAARLIAQKARLRDLGAESQMTMTQNKQLSVASLIADTDRLVQYCGELNAATAAQTEVRKLRQRTPCQTEPAPVLNREPGTSNSVGSRILAVTQRAGERFGSRCAKLAIPLARHFGLHKQ